MTNPVCTVGAFLRDERAKIPGAHPVSDKRTWGCSGPRAEFVAPRLRDAAEARFPYGAVSYVGQRKSDPPKWTVGAAWHTPDLPLPDLLHRLGTRECPECDGEGQVSRGGRMGPNTLGWEKCPTCNGTGRVGLVCESHLGLVTVRERITKIRARPGEMGEVTIDPPKLDPDKVPLTPSQEQFISELGLSVKEDG